MPCIEPSYNVLKSGSQLDFAATDSALKQLGTMLKEVASCHFLLPSSCTIQVILMSTFISLGLSFHPPLSST